MPSPAPSTYSPVVDPRDLASVPRALGPHDELHVPVTPPRGSLRPPSWMRRLSEAHRVVLSFCTSDRQLLKWDASPGTAEMFVPRVGARAAITLDVPFYRFMSAAARERALARSVGGIHRALRAWEPHGIEVIPLVKGLAAEEWEPQLEAATDLGLRRVALYVREQRLENDEAAVASLVKAARGRGLRPLLVGCFSPRTSWGPVDAAAMHHYVLARRKRVLARSGRARPVGSGVFSDILGRVVLPRDVASLVDHNFLRARTLFRPPAPLASFGFVIN